MLANTKKLMLIIAIALIPIIGLIIILVLVLIGSFAFKKPTEEQVLAKRVLHLRRILADPAQFGSDEHTDAAIEIAKIDLAEHDRKVAEKAKEAKEDLREINERAVYLATIINDPSKYGTDEYKQARIEFDEIREAIHARAELGKK